MRLRNIVVLILILIFNLLIFTPFCSNDQVLEGVFSCLTRWFIECTYPPYELLLCKDKIFFLDRNGRLWSISLSGNIDWVKNTGIKRNFYDALVACDDFSIYMVSKNQIISVDFEGNITKRYNLDFKEEFHFNDAVFIGKKLILISRRKILAFDVDKWEMIWVKDTTENSFQDFTPISENQAIFSSNSNIYKIDLQTGDVISKISLKDYFKEERCIFHMPVVNKDYGYVDGFYYYHENKYPSPLSYIWFRCYYYIDGKREEKILGIESENFNIVFPPTEIPKFGQVVGIFQDKLILADNFQNGSTITLYALSITGEILWERKIEGIEFFDIMQLGDVTIYISKGYKTIFLVYPFTGEILHKPTDININFHTFTRKGADEIGKLLDIKDAKLYLLWIYGDAYEERKERKGLLKLDLKEGKMEWNTEINFTEPKCYRDKMPIRWYR
jgi:outer membrane protein assembly factor BamB